MLKMKETMGCEIYISDDGYLTFKQDAPWPDYDGNMVLLSYEQTLVLQDYLPRLIAEQEKAWGGGVEINPFSAEAAQKAFGHIQVKGDDDVEAV